MTRQTVFDLSVIIPVFNRGRQVIYTLASVQKAAQGLRVEIILVDDGSVRPLADDLAEQDLQVDQVLRQPNQGLLFARLSGLAAARGRYILFLDSDDLVSPDKFRAHLDLMQTDAWDVTYSDYAVLQTDPNGKPNGPGSPQTPLPTTAHAPDLFLRISPPPHSPVFRTEYLRDIVNRTGFVPRAEFNSVAENWFYHKAAVHEARIKHLPRPYAIVCQHTNGRLTDHWERLCLASLCIMEHFVADPPDGRFRDEAVARVAANAMSAWRRHPHGMPWRLQRRFVRIWCQYGDPKQAPVGSGSFHRLAALIGTVPAAWLLRRRRHRPYHRFRTLSAAQLSALIARHPPPRVS